MDQEPMYKSKLASKLAPTFLKMVNKKLQEEDGAQDGIEGDMYQLGSLISTMLFGNTDALKHKKRLAEDGDTEPS